MNGRTNAITIPHASMMHTAKTSELWAMNSLNLMERRRRREGSPDADGLECKVAREVGVWRAVGVREAVL